MALLLYRHLSHRKQPLFSRFCSQIPRAILRVQNGVLSLEVRPERTDKMSLVTPSGATSHVIKRQSFDIDSGDVLVINGLKMLFLIESDASQHPLTPQTQLQPPLQPQLQPHSQAQPQKLPPRTENEVFYWDDDRDLPEEVKLHNQRTKGSKNKKLSRTMKSEKNPNEFDEHFNDFSTQFESVVPNSYTTSNLNSTPTSTLISTPDSASNAIPTKNSRLTPVSTTPTPTPAPTPTPTPISTSSLSSSPTSTPTSTSNSTPISNSTSTSTNNKDPNHSVSKSRASKKSLMQRLQGEREKQLREVHEKKIHFSAFTGVATKAVTATTTTSTTASTTSTIPVPNNMPDKLSQKQQKTKHSQFKSQEQLKEPSPKPCEVSHPSKPSSRPSHLQPPSHPFHHEFGVNTDGDAEILEKEIKISHPTSPPSNPYNPNNTRGEHSSFDNSTQPITCQAIKRYGLPCMITKIESNGYCLFHQSRAVTEETGSRVVLDGTSIFQDEEADSDDEEYHHHHQQQQQQNHQHQQQESFFQKKQPPQEFSKPHFNSQHYQPNNFQMRTSMKVGYRGPQPLHQPHSLPRHPHPHHIPQPQLQPQNSPAIKVQPPREVSQYLFTLPNSYIPLQDGIHPVYVSQESF
eukprot:TRINITY_DN11745_c0_g2_i8.p1 TRINITY_DN11745_c0_g2~~TRINITY_DN11745_c0_g2_i8.p1  ORF type:complete len:630 (-),score=142.42 TRINITY_DN11745_c0_g2_i8:1188-3077(-)